MLRQVSFGPFTLDAETRQLLRDPDRTPVHLSPKAYDLLCVLVETRPKAMSKAVLHERLWTSTFVSDATLASLVGELRDALGERGREARFIRTVHGFGYAFSAVTHETRERAIPPIAHWIVCNGREKALADGEHVIGRDADVAIPLPSPTVSRRHAKIVVAGAIATLEDVGSKNGTYVRGQAVTSSLQLTDGDQIRIGAFQLTFRTLGSDTPTETEQR
jgi:DNA-binding winged helix-turn-helix (wHTH) protein